MLYANAAEIMPEKLVREIQRYFPGGMLWIPKSGVSYKERSDLIVKLVENGVPVKEVAQLAEMSTRHVYRLVKKHSEKETGRDNN